MGYRPPATRSFHPSCAPGFKGENDEVLKIINDIFEATGGKGVVVYDRGGDRPAFYGDFIEKGRDFIVRVKSRSVLSWNGLHEISFLAENCTMQHRHHVTFDSHGKECNIQISFGTMPVRLPMFPDRQLHLVGEVLGACSDHTVAGEALHGEVVSVEIDHHAARDGEDAVNRLVGGKCVVRADRTVSRIRRRCTDDGRDKHNVPECRPDWERRHLGGEIDYFLHILHFRFHFWVVVFCLESLTPAQ